jgi:probable phosphoglycerate mutase
MAELPAVIKRTVFAARRQRCTVSGRAPPFSDTTVTKILLVRHGHVEGISPERFRGRADLPLTAEGRRQAAATAKRIAAEWRPAAIYSSPLGRCLTTSAAIGQLFGLSPVASAGLSDIDYGSWQGLAPEQARQRWPDEVDAWYRHPDWATIPGGETLQDVLARTTSTLREVFRRHPEDTVVLVGHDSVNRVVLLHALGLPLSRYWRIRQSPCAVNEIDLDRNGFTIVAINQTDHLRESPPAP